MFEQATRLNINLNKSSISWVNVTKERTDCVAQSWGMSTLFLRIQYLGMSLGSKPRTLSFWNNITDKVHTELNNWKYAHISNGGRLTLINSTLSSLPIYQLSVLKAWVGVCSKIEKYWKDFLWRGNYDNLCINGKGKKGLVHVKWTNSRDKCGLGITMITDTNFALLTKWLWRYHCEPKSFWRTFIDAKYTSNRQGEIPHKGRYNSKNVTWRSICKGIYWYKYHMKWKVNDGKYISFWHSISTLKSHWRIKLLDSLHYQAFRMKKMLMLGMKS